jgi:hypothetical protein
VKSILQNKKGQTIELIGGTILGFMVLIFTIFAVLYGISALNPSTFFTSGSAEANATSNLQKNLTAGIGGDFAAKIPTVFVVLAVVLVLSAIAVLIIYVRRMAGGNGATL